MPKKWLKELGGIVIRMALVFLILGYMAAYVLVIRPINRRRVYRSLLGQGWPAEEAYVWSRSL